MPEPSLPELLGLAPGALVELLEGPGRARAVYAALRGGRDPFTAPEIPAGARARLRAACAPTTLREVTRRRAADGTTKLLHALPGGGAVESVLIPERSRTTLCVSSQVGCARGCTFCLTATMDLVRNLTAAEITAQVAAGIRFAREEALPPLRNVVFMGMGEPLDNFDPVARALAVITSSELGLGFGPAHVTVSSVGTHPRVVRRAAELPANLAWSLHAADDSLRATLVPTTRHGAAELRDAFLDACRARGTPLFVELTLVGGLNDGPAEAEAAAALFAGCGVEVRFNLLPMNPIPGSPLGPSAPERVRRFEAVLREAGFFTKVRRARGVEERAACGQLAVLD